MTQDRPAGKGQKSANCDQNVAPASADTAAGIVAARLDRPVVLIGMMGTGKSQLGRLCAKATALPFADSDTEFEKAAGMPIADYFAKHGEAAFREGELRVMERLLDGTPKIIAAGGGIVTLPQTRALLKEQAIVVWLQASPGVLAARCAPDAKGGGNKRPLLAQGDPVQTLTTLLEKRGPLYQEVASMEVSTERAVGDQALNHILEGVASWLKT